MVKGNTKVQFNHFLLKSIQRVRYFLAVCLTCPFIAILTVKVIKSVKSLLSQFGLVGAKEVTKSLDKSGPGHTSASSCVS